MGPAQHHFEITGFEADALFASALQGSQAPVPAQIRQAIDAAVRAFGSSGCAGRVAQEFGDHPETAAARMRWAWPQPDGVRRPGGAAASPEPGLRRPRCRVTGCAVSRRPGLT